jgi:hypothetical protein
LKERKFNLFLPKQTRAMKWVSPLYFVLLTLVIQTQGIKQSAIINLEGVLLRGFIMSDPDIDGIYFRVYNATVSVYSPTMSSSMIATDTFNFALDSSVPFKKKIVVTNLGNKSNYGSYPSRLRKINKRFTKCS